jgi:preprotein translocase subunit SecE
MNQQTASLGGTMNTLKWAIVFALIGLGVAGNYHFGDQSLLIKVIGWLVIAALAALVAFQTESGKRFWEFALESRTELKKVVWPTRKETVQTTMMVLGVVAIVAVILWAVDILAIKIIAWLTGYYGAV